MRTIEHKNSALVKIAILFLFHVATIYLVRFSPARQYLTVEELNRFLGSAGLWAPVMFVFIYSAGVCLFLFTFFVGTIKDVWISGQWEELLGWKVFLSLALFIFSFFIPKLMNLARLSNQTKSA